MICLFIRSFDPLYNYGAHRKQPKRSQGKRAVKEKGNRRRRLRASERSAENAKRENDRTYRGKFFLFKAYDLEFFERESEI